MDFNDVNARLARLYVAVDARFDADVNKHLRIQHTVNETRHNISIEFDGGLDKAEAENKIILIISGLADLKDHLENKANAMGLEKNLIEDTVNRSPYLQLVIDLANSQKHGYPLTRREKSGKSPKLVDVSAGLQGRTTENNPTASFSFNPFTGQINTKGDIKIVISCSIVDGQDNHIMRLDELIEGVIKEWQKTIEANKLV